MKKKKVLPGVAIKERSRRASGARKKDVMNSD